MITYSDYDQDIYVKDFEYLLKFWRYYKEGDSMGAWLCVCAMDDPVKTWEWQRGKGAGNGTVQTIADMVLFELDKRLEAA